MDLFLDSLFYFTDSTLYSYTNSILSDYHRLVLLEIKYCQQW